MISRPVALADIRELIRSKVRIARRICADMTCIYYWDAKGLETMVEDGDFIAANYPDTIEPDELETLQLAADVAAYGLELRTKVGNPDTLPIVGGFVYVLSSDIGYYKIGCTTRPRNRLLTFGIQLPFDVDVLCTIFTRDMYRLENRLHREFAHKRVRGEWFKLDTEDVAYLKGLKE